jgi:hypothetical protein
MDCCRNRFFKMEAYLADSRLGTFDETFCMKLTLIIIGISIIIIVVVLFLTTRYWLGLFLDRKPREPKNEIPITFNIGWWSYQESLHIDAFEVKMIDNPLNLFNSHSLINYRIKGRLIHHKNNWEPFIDKIHISERVIKTDTIDTDSSNVMTFDLNKDTEQIEEVNINPEAIFELTPIIKVKENKSYKAGQPIEFDLTNEHKIQSLHWGNNYIMIKCGQYEYPLVLQQRK